MAAVDMSKVNFQYAVILGMACRLFWGFWVNDTDVDYHVFTDAAEFMVQGESPYKRPTYRYTPVIAYMLQPNILLHPAFGKLLFVTLDMIAGFQIYQILLSVGTSPRRAVQCACFWFLNPLPISVSSRGSAESLLAVLVLLMFQYRLKRRLLVSAFLYGLVVHIKIYPIIYALPLYLNIDDKYMTEARRPTLRRLFLTSNRVKFFIVAAGTFIALTAYCYQLYGWDFIQETYLYHVTRKDTRHNFSVYFYMLYLTASSSYAEWISLGAFIPQALFVLTFSFLFNKDLPFCWFLTTFAFVTFNKVCTSQYFLWYLCLLPLILPSLKMSSNKAAFLITMWVIGQAVWGIPASLLEFQGMDTYFYIWLASVMFCIINVYIMYSIIKSYIYTPWIMPGTKYSQYD